MKQLISFVEDNATKAPERTEFVRQLAEGSSFLDTQREEIMGLWDSASKIEILSFYETRNTATVAKVIFGYWAFTVPEG